MNLPDLSDVCFLDLETTGLEPRKGDRVIQIAILKMIRDIAPGNFDAEIFSFFINPQGKKSSSEALAVHKIQDEKLLVCPKFEEKIDDIKEFVGSRTIVAHNAPFDRKFINHEFKLGGQNCEFEWFDFLQYSKSKIDLKSYSLENICRRVSTNVKPSHDADDDVQALFELYVLFSQEFNIAA